MSTAVESPPRRRRNLLRVWLPWTVIAFLSVVGTSAWFLPQSEYVPRVLRLLLLVVCDGLASLLALTWWVLFSDFRWPLRWLPVAALAAAVVVGFLLIDDVQLDGDMVPVAVHFRAQPTGLQRIEAYRQTHPETVTRGLPPADAVTPDDYPCYRNRNRDGVVHGPALARDWVAKPPRELWKRPCGGGYAGFAVVAGRALTIEQRGGEEAVVCYNAATGDELWAYSYPARFYDARGGEGPMATPTVDRGLVFSLGGTGHLACLDLDQGKVKWAKDLLKPGENLTWGMSGSPLVYDEVVVVNPGGQNGRGNGRALIAFDRKSGDEVWGAGSTRAGYSSPALATLSGTRQVLLFDGDEVAGYDAAGKGGKLWSLPWLTNMGINVAQPLLLSEERVFVTSGYGVGCGVVEVHKSPKADGGWHAEEIDHARTMQGKFASPVLFKGLIYGLNEGVLACVNPQKLTPRAWSGARYGHGQILRNEDLLLVVSEKGELALVEASGRSSRELGRVKVLAGEKTWNPPCLAGGKAYVRNHLEMACYDLRE